MIWNRNGAALGVRERLILWLVVYKTGILVALLKDEDILNVSNLHIEQGPVEIEFHFSELFPSRRAFIIICRLTLARTVRRSSSFVSSQHVARKVSNCLVGGVVISKNLENKSLNGPAGNFSCNSHVLLTPKSGRNNFTVK